MIKYKYKETQWGFFPDGWNQTSCMIFASKYFQRAGVPSQTVAINNDIFSPRKPAKGAVFEAETSAEQVFERLAGAWTYWGLRGGQLTHNESVAFHKKCIDILYHQKAAPNSPQWFNTGLHWAYGIDKAVSGHYYVDDDGSMQLSTSAYKRPQPHACFIQSVNDELTGDGSIMDLWNKEAKLFRYGSGTGTNFSRIRGAGEPLSNGGVSSGVMSFLKIGDVGAGAIKSGGTTRRAAKMVILDADHPDIEDFIIWKAEEEMKACALSLGSQLMSTAASAISKNKSLSASAVAHGIPSSFVNGIKTGNIKDVKTYDLGWESEAYQTVSGQNSNNSVRITDDFMVKVKNGGDWDLINRTGGVKKTISADSLFDKIALAAWRSADPGLQFHDTINKDHTCPAGGDIVGSNPCSEYMFLDDTACNLASLNLVNIKDGEFEDVVDVMTIVLDISVTMAQFPSEKVAQGSYDYRTLGLGFANLHGALIRDGVSYDSDEARKIASQIARRMALQAWKTSAELAKKCGTFPKYAENKQHMDSVVFGKFPELKSYAVNGFRNAQVTCIAPTGTIGLIMGCDSLGCEPVYSLTINKTLAGGGSIRTINKDLVEDTLLCLGYDPESVVSGFDVNKEKLSQEHKNLFDFAGDINWKGHIDMMAAIQPYICGAISKTINMPETCSVDDIKNAYMYAWEKGIKAIALYRDKSKLSQPMNSSDIDSDTCLDLTFFKSRRKLPAKRNGITQKATVSGWDVYIHTGEYNDGTVGEVFADIGKQGGTIGGLLSSFAKAVSIALQYGAPIDKIVDSFRHTNFEPNGFVQGVDGLRSVKSLPDLIASVLEGLDDESSDEKSLVKTGDLCKSCGGHMIQSGTCQTCSSCGDTTGCG